MRSRYKAREPEGRYFVTSTIVGWLPVFTTAACCDILVSSFEYCRQHKGLKLYAWVIMENHFHAIVAAPDLSRTMGDLKKFTARSLLEQLRSEHREWMEERFAWLCARHKTSEHQVWQEGFHPQRVMSDAMMLQKLEYIHLNPVCRGLVASPEHWRYSSAHEQLPGALPVLRCDSWI